MHSSRRACLEKNGGVSHGVRLGNTSTSAAGLQPVRRLTLTLQSWQTFFRVVNFSLFFFFFFSAFAPFASSFFSLQCLSFPGSLRQQLHMLLNKSNKIINDRQNLSDCFSFCRPRSRREVGGSSRESSQPGCPTWATSWAPWRTGWPCSRGSPPCCTASWTCIPSRSLRTRRCSAGTSWT